MSFFFFNDTATTEIYTLSLHDALPIFIKAHDSPNATSLAFRYRHQPSNHLPRPVRPRGAVRTGRSEEHTSELQSLTNLVCRLLLEKKKISITNVSVV